MSEQEKRERLEMDGEVIDANKGQFRVKINDNLIAMCTLAGKIRVNSVKILIGDKVRVEISPYDLSRGRIVYRYKS
jgi:translation initiation factor IF-1